MHPYVIDVQHPIARKGSELDPDRTRLHTRSSCVTGRIAIARKQVSEQDAPGLGLRTTFETVGIDRQPAASAAGTSFYIVSSFT